MTGFDAHNCCRGCGMHRTRGHEPDCPGPPAESDTESDTVPNGHNAVTSNSDTRDSSDTRTQEEQDADLLAGLRNGTWLSEQEFPPLRWAVPGLVPEGLSLLIGPPKAGKSWLVVDWLLAIAAGGFALGKIPVSAKRPVLYLALEDGDRRMKSRCQAVYGTDENLPEGYHYETQVLPGQVIAYIDAFLRRYPETVAVVLDTLGKVMPEARMGESAYQRDYRIGGALKRIADDHPGMALVVVHHDRKAASEDFVDSVSGTNGLAGSADTIMVLGRKRKSVEAMLKVTGRDVPEEEYALRLDGGVHWVLDGGDLAEAVEQAGKREETQNISDKSVLIIEFIRRKLRPVEAKEVTDEFGDDARKYLTRHVEAGRLIKPKRGQYSVPDVPVSQLSQVSLQLVSGTCEWCGEPMTVTTPGQSAHPTCGGDRP